MPAVRKAGAKVRSTMLSLKPVGENGSLERMSLLA